MAPIFVDAWKSHILQDFQFPQVFPQRAVGFELLKLAMHRLRWARKTMARHLITSELLRAVTPC